MPKMDYTWDMDTMTTALRAAIQKDGRSLNKLGLAAGVNNGVLSRFMRGERDVTLSTADAICWGLGVDVRLVKPRRTKGGGR